MSFTKKLTERIANEIESEEFRLDEVVEGQKDLIVKVQQLELLQQNILARDLEIEKVRKEKYELQEKLEACMINENVAKEIVELKGKLIAMENEKNKLSDDVVSLSESSKKFEKL